VLVVVVLDLAVGDGHVARHLRLHLLADQRQLDPGADLLVGEALLLQRSLVALLDLRLGGRRLTGRAAVVLLLDLVEPVVDVLVRDVDPELLGLLLVLARRDQELRHVRAQVGELDRAGLRERMVRRLVVRLRLLHQGVPIRLRDRAVAHDRNVVTRHAARPAATAGGDDEYEGKP